jgi:WD40 repeat protein
VWPSLTPVGTESGVAVNVVATAASSDRRIAVADQRQGVRLVSDDGAFVEPLRGQADLVDTLAFSPDATVLATCDRDGLVALWDVDGRADVIGGAITGHTASVRSVVFTNDGACRQD